MINIEKQIAEEIAKANGLSVTKLGLRFDKVVVRLLGDLRTYIEQVVPKGETVIVTVTAPIKLPAKTGDELNERIRNLVESKFQVRDISQTIFQNKIRLKVVRTPTKRSAQCIGLVHNKDVDSNMLIKFATQYAMQEAVIGKSLKKDHSV